MRSLDIREKEFPTIRRISKHVGHVYAVHDIISKPRNEVVDEVIDGILPHALDVNEDISSSEWHVRISTQRRERTQRAIVLIRIE